MNSDIYMGLSRQIFLLLFCVLVTTKACTSGWFGSKCQFMCHCSGANGICDDTGRCLTKCDNGWFGQSCQYQDLATIPGATITSVPQQTTLTWLTDRDETTCNQLDTLTTIQISWDTSFPFTWLRLNVNSPDLLTIFTVTFKTTNHLDLSCNKLAMVIVDSTTVDFRCDINETVTQIILTGPGVKLICSLYISGGRNVALHQSAEQTSTYTENTKSYFASLAVDGNTNCYFYNGSTSHTGSEPNPSWNLTLDTPRVVNRFVIYNRADEAKNRLKNFNLTTFDINNKDLWSYQDQNPETALIYTFTRFESDPVSRIRIVPTSKESYDTQYILTLCEVLMYGDCVPGSWGLECNKTCPVECPGSCHQGTGTCFMCQGRSDPPLCNTACQSGQWGLNCNNQCSINCYDGSCDRITGQCDKGCNGFINPPFCNTECGINTWGPNCQFYCRTNCYNMSCNKVTGVCNSGCIGYMDPPNCIVECTLGKWGRNCVNNCSRNCKGQSCDRVTGRCDYVCDSAADLSCPSDCPASFHGANCSLLCSSNCKDKVCNTLGYCLLCKAGYTGLYCENDCPTGQWGMNCSTACSDECFNKSCDKTSGVCIQGQAGDTTESSGLTFPAGVGVGVAVGAVVVVLIVVVAVVCRRRRKRPQPQSHEEPKRGTRLHAYDGVKKINEYSHSYEETFAPDKFKPDEVKTDNKTVKTFQDPPNSIYDNIEECTSLGE